MEEAAATPAEEESEVLESEVGAGAGATDRWTVKDWLASLNVTSDLAAALLAGGAGAAPASELGAARKLAAKTTTEEVSIYACLPRTVLYAVASCSPRSALHV